MPRLRERSSEMPQRQSPRGPFQLRTSSSDSDPIHNRPTIDRSPKLGERRSPRGSSPNSVNQKKFGTRIADLESQLGQAQEELKKLKEQLASAEAAKKEAQEELEKKTQEPITQKNSVEEHHDHDHIEVVQGKSEKYGCIKPEETPEENSPETDVFEVPVSTVKPESKIAPGDTNEREENGTNEKLSMEMSLLKEEVHLLKAKLEEKDKDMESLREENDSLSKRVQEAASEAAAATAKEEETATKLNQTVEELNKSKANVAHLKKELEAIEAGREEQEMEMKKMRVQTDQWRKAADAAAAVLAGGTGIVGGRISERCVSMDKNAINNNGAGGYIGFEGSPIMGGEYSDDGFGGGGKRKGSSGIRMFGDLWKKKGQK